MSSIPGLEITIRNSAILEVEYEGRAVMSLSLPLMQKLYKAAMSLANTEEAKVEVDGIESSVTREQVVDYIKKYVEFVYEKTGRRPQYKMGNQGNYYPHFVKAVATCKRMNLAPEELFEMLTMFFTEMSSSSEGAVIPYPNQLHGEKCEMHLTTIMSRTNADTMPAKVRAKRLTTKRFRMSLEEDSDYQRIRRTLQYNKFSEFELEYFKARMVQKMGGVKDWVQKYEDRLNERLRAEKNVDGI